jgi:hypothetical protein
VNDLDGGMNVIVQKAHLEKGDIGRMVTDVGLFAFLFPSDTGTSINCLVGRLDVNRGKAKTEALLDTESMTVVGKGSVDLPDRSVDLSLKPEAKTNRLSSLAVPVTIQGPLAKPDVQPETSAIVTQLPFRLIGGLMVPLGAVSSLFDQDSDQACQKAVAGAQKPLGPDQQAESPAGARPEPSR